MLNETHNLWATQQFLLDFFKHADPESWLEVRALKSKSAAEDAPKTIIEVCKIKDIEASIDLGLGEKIVDLNQRKKYDIFFGVCPRREIVRYETGKPKAGGKAQVEHAVAAWVDIDREDWEVLLPIEETPSTYVVSSGRGAHLYFMYERLIPVETAVSDSSNLCREYFGDRATCESARVMRLPGTMSWKKPSGTPCEILKYDETKIFDGTIEKKGQTIPGVEDWNLAFLIKSGHESASGNYKSEKDGKIDRSAIDFRVMKELILAGVQEDQIREIFFDPENGISAKVLDEASKGNADNYFRVSFRAAYSAAEVSRSQDMNIGETLLLEDARTLSKAPQIKFAVDAIIPVGGMLLVAGPAKVGKSLVVTDLSLLLAGIKGKFLERFEVNDRGMVVYIQAEVTRGSLKFRYDTIAASRGSVWEDLPLRFYHGRMNLLDPKHVAALRKTLTKLKPKYLIIDPLARFHRGNENNQGDMGDLLSNIQSVSREAEVIGTVIVHHHGKPGAGDNRGIHKLRGASIIGDWANSYINVTKEFTTNSQEKYVQMGFELRDAEEPLPLSLVLNNETLRFRDYSESEEKLKLAMNVVDAAQDEGVDKGEIVERLREELKTTKSGAERMVKQALKAKKFGLPQKGVDEE